MMKTKIAVFFGGRSVEHEISVISANQAINALDRDRYSVVPVYITKKGRWYSGEALFHLDNYKDTEQLVEKCEEVYMTPSWGDYHLYKKRRSLWGSKIKEAIDVVFPVFHGTYGEDGVFQGLLELIGIPYVGSNTPSSANGMDKIFMKMILRESGIPVVDWIWFTDKEWFMHKERYVQMIEERLHYPVIVKPSNMGSSVGISPASNRDELIIAISYAEHFSQRILVEKMIVHIKEVNCAVLGDVQHAESSVCEEPIKSGEILSYEDKYLSGGKSSKGMQNTKRRIPADLTDELSEEIRGYALKTFQILSCNGVARVDFILDTMDNAIYVNEINTIPGSLSFYLWEASQLPFEALVDKLVLLALKRDREIKLKRFSYDQNIFNMMGSVKGKKISLK
jgi:D-alanine-D-alanine ligase